LRYLFVIYLIVYTVIVMNREKTFSRSRTVGKFR